jgi:hypothetical protein
VALHSLPNVTLAHALAQPTLFAEGSVGAALQLRTAAATRRSSRADTYRQMHWFQG